MPKVSESLIQEILDLKQNTVKTASKRKASKLDVLSETLIKMAAELEDREEEDEKEDDKKSEEDEIAAILADAAKEDEDAENEKEAASQAENIVEAALKELNNSKQAGAKKVSNLNYDKLAQAIMKIAVDGTGVYGLDADMTANPVADPGEVAGKSKADAAKRISGTNDTVQDMGFKGPVDPMRGNAPQSYRGDDTPLTPGEVKSAMAKMSEADAAMLFKLAQVGYDVTVDVVSDEIVEKQARAQVIEQAERIKAAHALNYLQSVGYNPYRRY